MEGVTRMPETTDSILRHVKESIGIEPDCTDFDVPLIADINAVFVIMNQMGVGPEDPFLITGDSETWSDFTQDPNLQMCKTYMSLKVQSMFDPPSSSTANTAAGDLIKELEWRLNVGGETFIPRNWLDKG